MTDRPEKPQGLGLGPQPRARKGLRVAEGIAAVLSIAWVAGVGAVVTGFNPAEGSVALRLVMTLLVMFMPVALIGVSVTTLRSIRSLRAEAARLQADVGAMRAAQVAGRQAAAGDLRPPAGRAAGDGAPPPRPADPGMAAAAPRALPDDQPTLALGNPVEDLRAPLSVADFVRALHFPESPDDADGFRALRLALEDRTTAKLIRAAQDVLTLLSQDGIYMDDLKPDRAKPEVWRRFAAGERGRAIAPLGGVRDRSCLALTASRMREDPVFRDAAHHFLRTFDRTFSAFEKSATDAELSDLADTRTARAFMLFGRVTGTFD